MTAEYRQDRGFGLGKLIVLFIAIAAVAIFMVVGNMGGKSQMSYQPLAQPAVSQQAQPVSSSIDSEEVLPAGFVYGMAVMIPATDGSTAVYIPTSSEHNVAHNVVDTNPAWATAQTAVSVTTGGPPPDPERVKCFVMRIYGQVSRYMVWEFTHANGVSGFLRGNIAWWHAANGSGVPEWGGLYSNKSLDSMTKVPKDVMEQYPDSQVEQIDCDQLPPAPPLAGA